MTATRFDDRDRRAIERFVAVDVYFTFAGIILVIAVKVLFIQSATLWVIVPFLILLLALLVAAHRLVTSNGSILHVLVLVIAGNWAIAVAVSVVIPFLWPVMALTVLMPVVLSTPFLERSHMMVMMVSAAFVAAFAGIMGIVNADRNVYEEINGTLELLIVIATLMVQILPIGLIVWQNNRLQHENLDRANDLNEQLLISRAELAASRRRVVHAGDIERRRIERDLHDGAQQRLVTLGVRLRLLESQTEDMPDVHHAVEDMIGELSAAIDEVRELSNGIYPPMLQSEGLVHALGEVARRSTTPVRTSLTHIERLDPSVETALYFTALEALTNTAKHAPGSLVDLRLVDEGSSLRLTVSDNGPGFEIDESKALASVNRLDDRVAAIGGTLTITSAIGKGTTVTAIVSKTDAIVPGTERSDQRV